MDKPKQIKADVGKTNDNHILGLWLCNCGCEFIAANSRVRNGYKQDCGCLSKERRSKASRSHGRTKTPEYISWQAMKRRCLIPDDKDFPNYGGKGLTIDPCLMTFEGFYSTLGPRPDGTTLDRIDNRQGYHKDNVRWATHSEQQRNCNGSKIWVINGKKYQTAQEAADYYNVTIQTIARWVYGYQDLRRNSYTPPKENCYAISRY